MGLKGVYITVLSLMITFVASAQEVMVGATHTEEYLPLLEGKRVAVLANHTAMYSDEEHVVDMLHREAKVLTQEYEADGVRTRAMVNDKIYGRIVRELGGETLDKL